MYIKIIIIKTFTLYIMLAARNKDIRGVLHFEGFFP